MTGRTRISGVKSLALLLVAMLAISTVAGGLALASPSDSLDYDGDTAAPNPYIDVDTMTVAKHPMSQGTSAEAMAGYENDNGDWVDDPPFVVNTTMDKETGDNVNPYTYDPALVEAGFYGEFPRTGVDDDGDQEASALNAGEWSTDESGSTGTATVSDTTVAADVDAVGVSTSGNDGTLVASYSNWTSALDSDESKRVIQLGFDVNSIDSTAQVAINITDESGDEKRVLIEPDQNVEGNADVAANGTGTYTYQTKLSDLTTYGGGDWENIESIDVEVHDADADVDFSWIDLERKTELTLGEQRVDSDGDGTWDETEVVSNSSGTVSVTSFDTLEETYDSATLTDVQFPAKYRAQDVKGEEGEEDAFVVYWEDAEQYPGYDTILNSTVRMSTVSAIDVSHSGMDLDFEQGFPADRHITAGYAEGVGDSANLSSVSLTDQTGSLGAVGDVINFDSTVNAGDNYAVAIEMKLTEDEKSAIEGGTGGAAAPAGGSGGFVDWLIGLPGAIMALIGGGLWGRSKGWF